MKMVNTLFMVVGILLALYGHIHWIIRHESTDIKTATDIMFVLPGWSLLMMGYIGHQCQSRQHRKNGS